jgi:uncharacterized protein (DUF2252 family)
MAADLSTTPTTGIEVQSCGDAHLLNFGMFASPERTLLFDLNDFDETSPAPWEWDVKRLAASAAVAADHKGLGEQAARQAAAAAVFSYRTLILHLATVDALAVFYTKIDAAQAADLLKALPPIVAARALAHARKHTAIQALAKMTVADTEGSPRIALQPPLVVPLGMPDEATTVATFLDQYSHSLRADVRLLLSSFTVVDAARKVVGVGSVGTRCFVVLLVDRHRTPLFLQVKQAESSVLAHYWPPGEALDPGQRVVAGQQIMQAASDVFLGWAAYPDGTHYYVRQLRDMKGSIDIDRLSAPTLVDYVGLCGRALARAHAQSGRAPEIGGYLGSSSRFDDAVADFAVGYARQVKLDHAQLLAAIADGRIDAKPGV